MSSGPAADLGIAISGAAGATNRPGSVAIKAHTDVYYVPLDMQEMIEIKQFCTYGDPLITAANRLRSDLAFGKGFHLRFAERHDILPEEVYDYTPTIRTILEQALREHDMWGFTAFAQRTKAAATEIQRQEYERRTGHEPTPAEISAHHVRECERIILEKIGNIDSTGENDGKRSLVKRRRRGAADDEEEDADEAAEAIDAQDTIDDPLMRQAPPQSRQPLREQVPPTGPKTEARIVRIPNGTTLLAPDSRLKLKRKNDDDADAVLEKSNQLMLKVQRDNARRQSILDMLIAMENVAFIQPEEGVFYLEIDNLYHTRRIVWAPAWRRPFTATSLNNNVEGRLRHVDYDPNVTVYVWPGRMPSDTGKLRSDYIEIKRLRQMVLESERNSMTADYVNSHPVPVIQQGRAAIRADLGDLPEEDIYGMDIINGDSVFDKDNMTPSELQTYRRDVRDTIRLEDSVTNFNRQQLMGRVLGMAGNNEYRSQLAGAYGTAAPANRQHVFESTSYLELPGGMQLGGQVNASVVVNTPELRGTYEMRLSSALGVPLTFLQGQNTNVSSIFGEKNSSSSSSTISMQMRTTVATDRDQVSRFFESMHDVLNRDADNRALATELGEVRSRLAQIDKAIAAYARLYRERYELIRNMPHVNDEINALHNEKARLCATVSELRRITSLMYRMRIHFLKTPFVETAELIEMYKMGAVSGVEMSNILRQNVGLEKIDDAQRERNCQDFADCAMMLEPQLRLQEEDQDSRSKIENKKLKLEEKKADADNKRGEKELKIKEKVANKPAPKPAIGRK